MANAEGQYPLDIALETEVSDIHDDRGHIDVALYLINRGCGDDEDKDKLLCTACRCDRLDVVEELVEEHDRDPNGEYIRYVCNIKVLVTNEVNDITGHVVCCD